LSKERVGSPKYHPRERAREKSKYNLPLAWSLPEEGHVYK